MPATKVMRRPKSEKTKNEDDDFDSDYTKKHGKLRDHRERKSRKDSD